MRLTLNETEVFFKLVQVDPRKIRLQMCDKNGNKLMCGNVLDITENGIYRLPYFDGRGIKLDDYERIRLAE